MSTIYSAVQLTAQILKLKTASKNNPWMFPERLTVEAIIYMFFEYHTCRCNLQISLERLTCRLQVTPAPSEIIKTPLRAFIEPAAAPALCRALIGGLTRTVDPKCANMRGHQGPLNCLTWYCLWLVSSSTVFIFFAKITLIVLKDI